MKIDINKVKINKDIYPRTKPDTETILRYRMNVDNLPPILLAKKDHTLIDGYHTLMAHRDEGREEIEYEIIDIPENKYFEESIRRNVRHGLQLSREEKKNVCIRLYEDWLKEYKENEAPSGDDLVKKKKDTAELLAVSQEIIRGWVKDIVDKIDDARKVKAWELWLACCTEDEIAEMLKVAQKSINQWISVKKQELGKSIIFPEMLQIYNIWSGITSARTENEYPGRLPLDVMENLLYYYTEPFNVVLDPMAGGGTTIEGCKKMSRRYLCYDLVGNPLNNIYQHDILTGMPKKKGLIPDLVFLDPPYWRQMDKYSKHPENLQSMPLEQYIESMGKIIKDAHTVLRDEGILAIIVSPTQNKKIIYDIQHQFYNYCEKQKFDFVNRIIVPYTTQQVSGAQVKQAKDGRYMLKLYRDLLIFKKV